jgi:DNA repair protein RadA/Sms
VSKKLKLLYVCSSCGGTNPRWQGQCPQCGEWNTLREQRLPGTESGVPHSGISPVSLTQSAQEELIPLKTGIPGFDEVLGQGVIPGGVILLGGEPGVGKSTVLLQLCASIAAGGGSTVYVSGEESLGQLKRRGARLGALSSDLLALSTTQAEDVLALFESLEPPDLIVVDSIQTMASAVVEGLPGSMTQVRAVASMMLEQAKRTGTALILVGHVTKEGHIAGPKVLEHMVDTVLYLEGDKEHLFRLLRVVKNRFGPANELLVLEMQEAGLFPVKDPSTFFLQTRDETLSGTAVVLAVDGSRPFAVEVQALACRSFLAIPRRTALGLDVNRLNLLVAVIEKKLRLNLGQMDIYAKIGGGLRLGEPGLDLGLVAAILSSVHDRPIPDRAAFWGEVDLNGQIRPVFGEETRARQAGQMGYSRFFCARTKTSPDGCGSLSEFQQRLFGTDLS